MGGGTSAVVAMVAMMAVMGAMMTGGMAVGWRRLRRRSHSTVPLLSEAPDEILRRRLAAGEIDEEEYRRLSSALRHK